MGRNKTVLFGNGDDNNLFGNLRGGGVKGPVLQIRKRLSEKLLYCKYTSFYILITNSQYTPPLPLPAPLCSALLTSPRLLLIFAA